jgi:hypothetical protein
VALADSLLTIGLSQCVTAGSVSCPPTATPELTLVGQAAASESPRPGAAQPSAPEFVADTHFVNEPGSHGDMAKAVAEKDEVQRLVPGYSMARLKANQYSVSPEWIRLREANLCPGLRKAGLPEK